MKQYNSPINLLFFIAVLLTCYALAVSGKTVYLEDSPSTTVESQAGQPSNGKNKTPAVKVNSQRVNKKKAKSTQVQQQQQQQDANNDQQQPQDQNQSQNPSGPSATQSPRDDGNQQDQNTVQQPQQPPQPQQGEQQQNQNEQGPQGPPLGPTDPPKAPEPDTNGQTPQPPAEQPTTPETPPPPASTATLKSAAKGIKIGGVIHGYFKTQNDNAYFQIAKEQFNMITTTCYMPWGAWPQGSDKPDTQGFAKVVDFAVANNMDVHGHALVYPFANKQYWDKSDKNWTKEEVESTLKTFTNAFASVRRGKVDVWDVVNEVLGNGNEDADGLDTSYLEYKMFGYDYILNAFKWAEEADPGAKLIINDWGINEEGKRSDNMLKLVKRLRADGAKVSGVGFQMHWLYAKGEPNYASMRRNIQRFKSAGFDVYFLEMDVAAIYSKQNNCAVVGKTCPNEAQLLRQKKIYKEMTKAAVESKGVKALVVWEFADNYSWMHPTENKLGPIPKRTYTYPSLYSGGNGQQMEKKEAFYGVLEGLQGK